MASAGTGELVADVWDVLSTTRAPQRHANAFVVDVGGRPAVMRLSPRPSMSAAHVVYLLVIRPIVSLVSWGFGGMLLIIALVLEFWVQMPHVYEQRWGLAAV